MQYSISTHIGFQCCMNFVESFVSAELLWRDYYSLDMLVINTGRISINWLGECTAAHYAI